MMKSIHNNTILLKLLLITTFCAVLLFSSATSAISTPPAYADDLRGIAPLRLFDLSIYPNATCLDGTPGGHYVDYNPDPAESHKMLLAFEGGGWVSTPEASLARSKTTLGSSKEWALQKNFQNLGVWSNDATRNPVLSAFNRAYLPYCDGTSNGGRNSFMVNGVKITHHGDYIADAHLDILLNEMKARMVAAQNTNTPQIIVSGCSAGGIASLLNSEKVLNVARRVFATHDIHFGTVPCSGVFLEAENLDGARPYREYMRDAFAMAKPEWRDPSSPRHSCFQQQAPGEEWKCFFGQNLLKTMTTPVYILNSINDSWSIRCIFTSQRATAGQKNLSCGSIHDYNACSNGAFVNCTSSQVSEIKHWGESFLNTIYPNTTIPMLPPVPQQQQHQPAMPSPSDVGGYYHIGTDQLTGRVVLTRRHQDMPTAVATKNNFQRHFPQQMQQHGIPTLSLPPRSSVFLHTCYSHCEGSTSAAWNYAINGISISRATADWWTALVSAGKTSAKNWNADKLAYLPCELSLTAPFQCNPTCPT